MTSSSNYYPKFDFVHLEEVGHNCLLSTSEISDELFRSVNLTTKVFEEKDTFLTDAPIDEQALREGGTNLIPKKNGQKQLLIVETFFLTKCLKEIQSCDDTKFDLLYIGGAPGDHLNILAEMFSSITFHVYDPLEMHIYS